MANLPVLDPAETRPIFDDTNRPGGVWATYVPRATCTAVLIPGPFLVRKADGTFDEMDSGWVAIIDSRRTNQGLGILWARPAAFALAYQSKDDR